MAVSTDAALSDGNGFLLFPRIDGATWAPLDQSFLLQIMDRENRRKLEG
jgi:hypothetical protein